MKDRNVSQLKAFYTTVPVFCPYLPDRTERKLATDVSGADGQRWANVLSRAGFRRSHSVCYIPVCEGCRSCVSVRIVANGFRLSKKMKKVLRLNEDLSFSVLPNVADSEQYALFRRYLAARHADSEMNAMYFEEFRAMIEDSPVETVLAEARNAQTGELKGVMLTDVLDDGLSAVYSFFDTQTPSKSLGRYLILKLVEETVRRGLPYVYLGYFIPECPNMAYKSAYRPLEYCCGGKWSPHYSPMM